MPRLISDRLGQTTLGIWDFAWSIVSYLGIVGCLGLGPSVQRYVPRFRATRDWAGLSRSVSTIGLVLKVVAALVMLLTLAYFLWGPLVFRDRLGTHASLTRWVVLFFGMEIAFSFAMTLYGGVIVGCHRWDIQNTLSAAGYACVTLAMIAVLLAGGGLAALALAHFLVTASVDIVRWRIAFRVCPELVVSARNARWSTWLEQARFSGKTVIPRVAELLSNQTLNILILAHLGPAALAIYARPRNLVAQFQALAARYGNILIPTSSSLQATAELTSIRHTCIKSACSLSCLMLPVLIALSVFGDDVISLWMGSFYVVPGLVAILALALFPGLPQEPVWSVLTGLNQHGTAATLRLAGAAASVVLLAAGLSLLKFHLIGAALCLAAPRLVVDALLTPMQACRRLGIPASAYYINVFVRPSLCATPYTACLLLARWLRDDSPWSAAASCVLAVGLLAAAYWQVILPPTVKRTICVRLFPACRSVDQI